MVGCAVRDLGRHRRDAAYRECRCSGRAGAEGLLINISRAQNIDEEALLVALSSGTLRGAALDVFEGKPNLDPRFTTLGNALLQPHHASGTFETRRAICGWNLSHLTLWARAKCGCDRPLPGFVARTCIISTTADLRRSVCANQWCWGMKCPRMWWRSAQASPAWPPANWSRSAQAAPVAPAVNAAKGCATSA